MISGILLAMCLLLSGQVPRGFNFQAVARDSQGELIADQTLEVVVSLYAGSENGTLIWEETHQAPTNEYGLMVLEVCGDNDLRTGGSAQGISEIDWTASEVFIGLKINDGSGWSDLGASKLLGVPYSLVSATSVQNAGTLEIRPEDAPQPGQAIFMVRREDGYPVFAVYEDQVWVYTDTVGSEAGIKGGFAIGGYNASKGPALELMRVNADSTRIYVKEDQDKGVKGGFAIGGYNASKSEQLPFMSLESNNYFIGHQSGSRIEGGEHNSVLGYESGLNITSGNHNAFLGYQSGYNNTEGSGNLFLGYKAGYSNTTGSFNTFLGYNAGLSNEKGTSNTFLGSFSGQSNDEGYDNTFVGDSTGISNTYGRSNTFLGTKAGYSNIGGNYNIFIGYKSGYSNQDAGSNVFLGNETGSSSVNGWNNIYLGTRAGLSNVDGQGNVMIGYESGMNNINGNGNIFLGAGAGLDEKGNQKLYVGYGDSTLTMIWGDQQTRQMRFNSRVGINVTPGEHSLSVYDHVGEGSISLSGIGGAQHFTGINLNSNEWNDDRGYKIAYGRDHSFLIMMREEDNYFTRFQMGMNGNIGINTYPRFANLTILNESDPSHIILTGIGNEYDHAMLSLYQDMNADTAGFQISYTTRKALVISQKDMDGSDARLKINKDGNVMINSWDDPTQTLDVNGNARFRGVGSSASANDLRITWDGTLTTSTSDVRLKTEFQPIEDGLGKVLAMEGLTFEWREENTGIRDAGLVAQDVQEVFPEAVFENPKDGYLGINYSRFPALFVEAFKDQQHIIDLQQQEIVELKQRLEKIESLLNQ